VRLLGITRAYAEWYVNFKWKTQKRRGIQCEDVAATRRLNAPWAAAFDRRAGDAK
jgi:hypothetical protein